MKPFTLNQRYDCTALVSEDVVSFCYEGEHSERGDKVWVFKYKRAYLTAAVVTQCIDRCERLLTLTHDRVLPLIDYHYDGESLYTVSRAPEPCVTLDTFLKQYPTVDFKTLWSFSTQVLALLTFLEQEKLVCGTLNFSTLLVGESGNITLARLIVPLHVYTGQWQSLDVVEDVMFLAPEYLEAKQYSSRSDMYAFGMLLAIFFGKRWPYSYVHTLTEMKKQMVQGPAPFEPVSTQIPHRLTTIIHVCLQIEPAARFRSFRELIQVYKGGHSFVPDQGSGTVSILKRVQTTLQLQAKAHQRHLWQWVGCIVFLVLLIGVAVQGYAVYVRAIPEVAVPAIAGHTQKEALEVLQAYRLEASVAGTQFHPHIPAGIVIESKPPGGRIVKEDRHVRLFVSKGKSPLIMPDLIGYSQALVQQKLRGKNVTVEVKGQVYSLQYPVGTVVAQEPPAQSFLADDATLSLTLSKGYPVAIRVYAAKSLLFYKTSPQRRVEIDVEVDPTWPDQHVEIRVDHLKGRETVYKHTVLAGEQLNKRFTVEKGSDVRVYLNGELAKKQRIETLSEEVNAVF